MREEIFQITSSQAGPTSIILAGVHGDEICGVKAVEKILPNIKINSGKVFWGYGNPRAIAVTKRFTEANLNRMFVDDNQLSTVDKNSYEYQRANFLKPYLDQAEALLDLHASSVPDSRPFAICENNAKELVRFLPIDLIVSGFDEVEPGGTDYYMNKNGKIGICLECGYLDDTRSLDRAEKSIMAFLGTRGHLANTAEPQQQTVLRVYQKYYAKTDNLTLTKQFNNFELIKKNQTICKDGEEEVKADRESFILFAHDCKKSGSEAFLLGEKKNPV